MNENDDPSDSDRGGWDDLDCPAVCPECGGQCRYKDGHGGPHRCSECDATSTPDKGLAMTGHPNGNEGSNGSDGPGWGDRWEPVDVGDGFVTRQERGPLWTACRTRWDGWMTFDHHLAPEPSDHVIVWWHVVNSVPGDGHHDWEELSEPDRRVHRTFADKTPDGGQDAVVWMSERAATDDRLCTIRPGPHEEVLLALNLDAFHEAFRDFMAARGPYPQCPDCGSIQRNRRSTMKGDDWENVVTCRGCGREMYRGPDDAAFHNA